MILAAAILLAACNNETPKDNAGKKDMSMSYTESKTERNKKAVMESMAGINAHSAVEALKNSTADGIDYGDGNNPPVKGMDSLKASIQAFLDAFPDYHGDNISYMADGDQVVVLANWSGTFKKDLWGMKATGKSFKLKDADVFTLNADGKITEHRQIQSMGPVFASLGVPMK